MKLIKFDLPINGTKVKNLEELRDNLTDEILVLARSGQLERWLRTRQLPEQAQSVATTVRREGSDKGLFLALCKVLEVEVHPGDVKAIFDAPPTPGRFIPGARYFQLYEELRSRVTEEELQNSKNSSTKRPEKKVVKIKYKQPSFAKTTKMPFSQYDFSWLCVGLEDGVVQKVCASKGMMIKKGDPIIEVESQKSTWEILSSITGIVEEVFVHIGEKTYINQDLISVMEIKS